MQNTTEFSTNSAVVVLYDSEEYHLLDGELSGYLDTVCNKAKLDGKTVKSVDISYPDHPTIDYITIVQWQDKISNTDLRTLGGKNVTKYKGKVDTLYFALNPDTINTTEVYDGAMMASYNFDKYKSKTSPSERMPKVHIETVSGNKTVYNSINFARDLVSEPANELYPRTYAHTINDMLTPLGVNVRIYHQSELEQMGFNLLLSVGQGSAKDSYVVVMEWMNGDEDDSPIALVGKGVTFDTGGISIKPSAGMGDMKYDMGGSASVVGAMHAIASNELTQNVVGIVGLVENMPSSTAIKPGDVVTSLSGQTVENLNTDAEGRLVLADILTHVQDEYDPLYIVDLSTLTGAIVVSLASEMAGLFTNSTHLSENIIKAGKDADEGFYRMPMGPNWNKMIDSDIADMKNISSGRGGGSTTAAEFLYRFVDNNTPWAHLDIAGMAWEKSGKPVTPKGAVGFGVRTLYNLVKAHSSKKTKLDVDSNMDY